MESQEPRQANARIGAGDGDRLRGFLVDHGLIPAEFDAERDERIFNAGLTCIELAMQPYERRLLRRASHDADRIDALLVEMHGKAAAVTEDEILTPASYREFVTVLERDLHPRGDGGPVPMLFRTGASLIAASYNPADESIARCAQRDLINLRAVLEFLDDLLDWIEAGKRGDRLETLQEARDRLDAIDQQVSRQHEELRGELQRLAGAIEEPAPPSPELTSVLEQLTADLTRHIASVERSLVALRDEVIGARDGATAAVVERLGEVESSLGASAASQREALDGLATRIARDSQPVGEPAVDAIAQLRSLVLASLGATAIVAVLVVVVISMI
jgi:hypothetical protein